MSDEDIKVKLEEMIEFFTLNTDMGIVTQTERTKMLEEILNLIDKQEGYISKDKIREKIKEIENSGLRENIKACVCNTLAKLL